MKNIKDMSENIEMKTLLQRFCDERIEAVLQDAKKHFMALGAHPASKALNPYSRIGKLVESQRVKERRVRYERTDDGRVAWRKRKC